MIHGRGDMSKKSKKSKKSKGPGAMGPQSGIEEFDAAIAARPKMQKKEYEVEMRRLQGELVAMQQWVRSSGAKIMVVFEGRDTAGKGGELRGLTERTNPRVFRHVALPAPTQREQSQ